jgi:sugar phosphate isomerase/epimerase
MSRRSFLVNGTVAALGGGLLAACAHRGAAATGAAAASRGAIKPTADRIGVQLYTVRDQLQQDFEGTLERVAKLGYRQVEFAGYYDHTPAQVKAILDRLGLTSPSAHIGVPLLRQDVAAQIASAKTIGQQYVTVPSYPFPREAASGADAWKAAAAEFNKWGEACRAQGIKLAYHNHNFELRPIAEGLTGLDVLVRETDPALVDFECDLYWATHAGVDPVQLFAKYPGRFAMWHVKDMRDPQGTKAMTPVGQGTIDFKRIFAHASESGLRYFFVEHDDAAKWPGGSLASLEASANYLKQLLA